jgi:predicted metal-dependent hydrolase
MKLLPAMLTLDEVQQRCVQEQQSSNVKPPGWLSFCFELSRLGWIRRQQARFAAQPRQSEREMVHGESHYVWGRRYRLMIEERDAPPQVRIHGGSKLVLQVRPGAAADKRRAILNAWYRAELKARIPDLIAKWGPLIGVQVTEWRIKRMKTRWGTCNIEAQRIWLNLELAKKPPHCLEYVLVHEMVHLLEQHHNERFRALMDQFMPQWQLYRDELNRAPLAHEHWEY